MSSFTYVTPSRGARTAHACALQRLRADAAVRRVAQQRVVREPQPDLSRARQARGGGPGRGRRRGGARQPHLRRDRGGPRRDQALGGRDRAEPRAAQRDDAALVPRLPARARGPACLLRERAGRAPAPPRRHARQARRARGGGSAPRLPAGARARARDAGGHAGVAAAAERVNPAAGFVAARHASGSAEQPSHWISGRRANTIAPPSSVIAPSTATAPPAPSHAARPAVSNAPNGSRPTNAAAQIAIARARIASDAIPCTTTVESPMNTTPPKPPTTAKPSESATELESPTPMIAAALTK